MVQGVLAKNIIRIVLAASLLPAALGLIFLYQYIKTSTVRDYQKNLQLSAADLQEELQERLEFIGAEISFIASGFNNGNIQDSPQFSKLFKGIYKTKSGDITAIKGNEKLDIKVPPLAKNSNPYIFIDYSKSSPHLFAITGINKEKLIAEINLKYLWQLKSSVFAKNAKLCVAANDQAIACNDNIMPDLNQITSDEQFLFSSINDISVAAINIPKLTIISFVNKKDIYNNVIRYFIGASITLTGVLILIYILVNLLIQSMMFPLTRVRKQLLGYVDHIKQNKSKNELDQLVDSMNYLSGKLDSQNDSLSTMAKIDKIILSSLDINAIIESLKNRITKLMYADNVDIYIQHLPHHKDRKNTFKLSGLSTSSQKITLSDNEYNLLFKNRSHVLIDHISQIYFKSIASQQKSVYSLYLPIFAKKELVAFIAVNYKKSPLYDKRKLKQARELANRFAVAIDNFIKDDKLYHQANFDLLTDLPNRHLFHQRLDLAIKNARQQNSQVAVLYIDLDKFKVLNDAFGHIAGDQYLKNISSRMGKMISVQDTFARIGGDEFVVILTNISEQNTLSFIAEVADNIQHEIARPCKIYGNNIILNSSIGIAIYPHDADNAGDLLKAADAALYYAKTNTSSEYQFYSQDIDNETKELLLLENNLNQAIANNELKLYFQPKINSANKQITGAEALIRWEKGSKFISPEDFIPIAEDSGLIQSMGEWSLQIACQTYQSWKKLGFEIPISINLSPSQFQNTALHTRILSLLKQYNLPASAIELELTESTLMHQSSHTVSILQKIKDIGIHLAIDDFGTGYSSFSYLKNFPIDTIKIDKSFIRDIESNTTNSAIVEAIINLGRKLQIKVIAEGVENTSELMWLNNHGCTEIQGYIYSKPLPKEDFEKYLVQNSLNTATTELIYTE